MAHWMRFEDGDTAGFGSLTAAGDAVEVHDGDMFAAPRATGRTLALAQLRPLPPVQPSKIVALWNNSRAGAQRQKLAPPERPLYFVKTANAYNAPGATIPKPAAHDGRVIFEAELGVVIGKTCKTVSAAQAADYVFGYTCVNDVTAVELIREDPTFPQWTRAKNFDGFAPFGPAIVTDMAPGDLDRLSIRAELNGRERQNYLVSDLFFGPLELVSLISRDMTLVAGDIISCGTGPGAVPMKPGDRIEIVIERVGRLGNVYGT